MHGSFDCTIVGRGRATKVSNNIMVEILQQKIKGATQEQETILILENRDFGDQMADEGSFLGRGRAINTPGSNNCHSPDFGLGKSVDTLSSMAIEQKEDKEIKPVGKVNNDFQGYPDAATPETRFKMEEKRTKAEVAESKVLNQLDNNHLETWKIRKYKVLENAQNEPGAKIKNTIDMVKRQLSALQVADSHIVRGPIPSWEKKTLALKLGREIDNAGPSKYAMLTKINTPVVIQHPKKRYKFTEGDRIGSGAFGKVIKVKNEKNEIFAMKVVYETGQGAVHEIRVMKLLRKLHCGEFYVAEMVNSFKKGPFRYLQFPLYGETLKKRIYMPKTKVQPEGNGLEISQIIKIVQQMLSALAFLHKYHILHCDIKTDNIMFVNGNYEIVEDQASNEYCIKMENPEIRLIDFGLAVRCLEKRKIVDRVCCATYEPPESILGTGITYAVDVWCVGLATMAMYLGRELFKTGKQGKYELELLAQMEIVLGHFPKKMLDVVDKPHYYFSKKTYTTWRVPSFDYSLLKNAQSLKSLKEKFPSPEKDKLFALVAQMLAVDKNERPSGSTLLKKWHEIF